MTKNKSDGPDVFVANKSYPDAKNIFYNGYKSLEEVRDSCLVILDTNALLVPYGLSKNGLSEIASTYNPLARDNRLVVPGQVAREFAKNRPLKISEIFQAISRKRNISSPEKGRYPLLEDVPNYEKLHEFEEQIESLIREYRKTISKVLGHIQDWNWDDPVSKLYSELFPKVVIDPAIDEKSIKQKLTYLKENKVPPGYKDSTKLDEGIGDLLVWQVVIDVAKERKLPVVFVSGDTKADWFYRSEGQALFPRFELVDEIRRVSDGQSLHIVSFSKFLELFGATEEAVGEARSEEIKIDLSTMSTYARNSVLANVSEQAVSHWLLEQYPMLNVVRDDRTGNYSLQDRGGANTFVTVKYFPTSRSRTAVLNRLRDTLARFDERYPDPNWEYDNILVFLVFESEIDADDMARNLPNILDVLGNREPCVAIAHLPKGGSLRVHDPLDALPKFE